MRTVLVVFAAVLASGALGWGLYYCACARYWESTDDAFIEGHVIPISAKVSGYLAQVAAADNQQVSAGDVLMRIDARDCQIRVEQARAALEAARARQAAAKSNIDVTERTSVAALNQACAAAAGAKSAVETAQAQVRTAQFQEKQRHAQISVALASTEEAKANTAAAEAEAVRSKLEWLRYKELRGTHAVTQQQADNAEAAHQAAQARLDAARKAIAVAEAQTSAARAEAEAVTEMLRQTEFRLAQARAQQTEAEAAAAAANIVAGKLAMAQAQSETAAAEIRQAEAALKQAELDLSNTQITAPVRGLVTRKKAEEGAFVQPGQTLMAIVPSDVWVIANFKETQLTRIRPGQEVRIRVDAFPEHALPGRVESIQRGTGARFSLLPPENASGNYVKVVQRVPVKIVFKELPAAGLHLAPGLSVLPEVNVK